MFDFLVILVATPFVTLFVLGLIWLVQRVLSFFQRSIEPPEPVRTLLAIPLDPPEPVGTWLAYLFFIVMWLKDCSELLSSGSPSEWTKDEYLTVFTLCLWSYVIVMLWRSKRKPAKESTKLEISEDGGDGRP